MCHVNMPYVYNVLYNLLQQYFVWSVKSRLSAPPGNTMLIYLLDNQALQLIESSTNVGISKRSPRNELQSSANSRYVTISVVVKLLTPHMNADFGDL